MKLFGKLMACAAAALAWGGPPAPATAAGAARGEGKRAEASVSRAEAQRAVRTRREARAGGRVQRGKASYYAPGLAGRRMADGGRFDPRSDAAAHRTLPLGTKARVRNLENGRTATVTVRDRGPRAPGRILDVSPGTAERLGMKGEGVAAVEVAPLGAAPRAGGGAEPGSAAGGGGPGRGARR